MSVLTLAGILWSRGDNHYTNKKDCKAFDDVPSLIYIVSKFTKVDNMACNFYFFYYIPKNHQNIIYFIKKYNCKKRNEQ
jgi:hypothetical protein